MPQPGVGVVLHNCLGRCYLLLAQGTFWGFFTGSLQILLSDLDVLSAVISKGQKFLKKGGEFWLMAQCRSPTVEHSGTPPLQKGKAYLHSSDHRPLPDKASPCHLIP